MLQTPGRGGHIVGAAASGAAQTLMEGRHKAMRSAGSEGGGGVPELIDRIKATSDYYDLLGVPRDASSTQITKAFRKLALKLHPDKCSLPGGDEAFKKVSNAFSVLSDKDRREHFDRFGEDPPGASAGAGAGPVGVDIDELVREIFRNHARSDGGGPSAAAEGFRFAFRTPRHGGRGFAGDGPMGAGLRPPRWLESFTRYVPLNLVVPLFFFFIIFVGIQVMTFLMRRAHLILPLFVFPLPSRVRLWGFFAIFACATLGYI